MEKIKCKTCGVAIPLKPGNTLVCPVCGNEYTGEDKRSFVDSNNTNKKMGGNNMELTCKSCGGKMNKEGNVFVCEQCGEVYKNESVVKYGNVEIRSKTSKTEKVFSEEQLKKLDNLYTVARRAKDDANSEQAEKYYDLVLQEDPNSWEAVYYTAYFNSIQTTVGHTASAANKLSNCLESVFNLIEEFVPCEEEAGCIAQIFTRTESIASMLYRSARNHYEKFKDTNGASFDYLNKCEAIYLLLCNLGDQLEKRFIDNPAIGNMCATVWKHAIDIRKTCTFYSEESKQQILLYAEKVKKYDSSYEGIQFKNGGCYVATCVYGSYDCPEVWTLRRFRDYSLDETWYGRAFIRTYYAISPTIVKWFGETEWFKKLWKGKLDKFVRKLNKKGYENTKYNDRY